MKKAATKLLAFILCPILLQAQENQKADSLLKLLPATKEDTNKVKLLFSELKESDAAILGSSALVWEMKVENQLVEL